MAQHETDVFVRLERFYDAVPRDAAVAEDIGGFVLFARQGEGWPFYARPRLGADTPSAADITAVRRRQRELGAPEAFEWVHETTPDLLAVARSAGLDVLLAPLMTLEHAALVPDLPVQDARIRFLDATDPGFADDLYAHRAVAQLGFATVGPVPAGPRERDTLPPLTEATVEENRRRFASGRLTGAVVESPTEGVLSSGMVQRVDDVAEIVGVATLPVARRRGYASQLTASLARQALRDGAEVVFLSAGDDDIARLYSKVGFRRLGTACIAEPAAVAL